METYFTGVEVFSGCLRTTNKLYCCSISLRFTDCTPILPHTDWEVTCKASFTQIHTWTLVVSHALKWAKTTTQNTHTYTHTHTQSLSHTHTHHTNTHRGRKRKLFLSNCGYI